LFVRGPNVMLGYVRAENPGVIERNRIKANDPSRRQVIELFNRWAACHGSQPMTVAALAKPVTTIIDPQKRGQQHIVTRLTQLMGTCAGGFTLTQQENLGGAGGQHT
jgi:hypothetical protein